MSRGIYRHTNAILDYFGNDVENALVKIASNTTTIIAGDINISLVKLENDNTINYLATLLSNQHLFHVYLTNRRQFVF